jgi:hypothetical protein
MRISGHIFRVNHPLLADFPVERGFSGQAHWPRDLRFEFVKAAIADACAIVDRAAQIAGGEGEFMGAAGQTLGLGAGGIGAG